MPPRSRDRLLAGLAVLGLLISAYLTLLHYDRDVPLVCGHGSFVNCESVLDSPSAMVFGVPVAAGGLLWFAGTLALALLSLRATRGDRDRPDARSAARLHTAGLGWALVGTAGVLWLVYQELGVVGRICAWCTAVHVIVLAMLVLQVLGAPRRAAPLAPRS